MFFGAHGSGELLDAVGGRLGKYNLPILSWEDTMLTRTIPMVLYLGLMFCLAAFAMTEKVDDDPPGGEALYTDRCGQCHSLNANREGPKLRGLFGRKAGSVADFEYSRALESSTMIWDQATLDSWLTDPEKFISRRKMSVKVDDPVDRAAIIAYLKTIFTPGAD